MDGKCHKRLIIITALLLAVLAAAVAVTVGLTESLHSADLEKLGRLILGDQEQEGRYVAIFRGKAAGDASQAFAAGRQAEEKYGYGSLGETFLNAGGWMMVLVILLAAAVLLAAALIWQQSVFRGEERLRLFRQEDEISQLRSQAEILREQMRREQTETKTLVTDISHQLKTPLAALKMCYEIAETSEFTAEEQQDFLMRGYNEVVRLENLTQSLLQLSRLETRLIQLSPRKESLQKTLLGAVNNVYMKAFEKGITIEAEEFPDVEIFHDPRWTREAFANVLDNAVKYAPPQSAVYIRVEPMISYYLIEVEDEGIGISRNEANHIFQRFYRGKDQKVQETEGTGVGLYLTRKILEDQGGSIRVKNGRKGSLFQMTLPWDMSASG